MVNDIKKLAYLKNARNEYRSIAINQLSFFNNLLLTLSIGFLTFGIDKEIIKETSFYIEHEFSSNKFFLIVFIMGTVVSICYGIAVNFCRLMDFRLTRYILGIRVRIMQKHRQNLDYSILKGTHLKDRVNSFWKLLFYDYHRFDQEKIDNFDREDPDFKTQFINLRKLAKDMGSASIYWTKYQALFFIIAVFAYVFHLLTL